MAQQNVVARTPRSKSQKGIDLSAPINPSERDRLQSRLAAQTQKTETCWLWTGYRRNALGHGALSIHDFPVWAHRLAFALAYGPIPEGACVCHRCDVPHCVRPDHLFLGTQVDNMADMRRKGRGANPPKHHGMQNSNATLTDAEVGQIRRLMASGVGQREIAKRFGCSNSTAWRIGKGKVRQ